MSLTDIFFSPPARKLPQDVADYLREMESSVEQFRCKMPGGFRGFVPSDYVAFYSALSYVLEQRLACGNLFCEWGSGLGVATCLAGMLGFDAHGIEIDEELSHAAQQFADELDLPIQLVQGSFLPCDIDDLIDDAFTDNDGCIAMYEHAGDAYAHLGSGLEDYDVVFAFPWPNDEELTAMIFERFASSGALLLTYDENNGHRLRRK